MFAKICTMILPLATAAISTGANIFGQIQANKDQKKANAFNTQRMNDVGSWFNKEYYGNYLNTDIARSALGRIGRQLKDSNKIVQNQAAAGGATPEAVIAQSDKTNNAYADAVSTLVGHGDERKNQSMYMYKGLMQPLEANQANILAGKANSWNTFGSNVASSSGNILNAWANGAFDKK